ncbi:hypothetical protein [Dubosiella newyorkensis]|uniref:hypothetical protein n=1 Tax=Dubosiella newyorkensis TaxID=1862672 RepID=UPI003F669B56
MKTVAFHRKWMDKMHNGRDVSFSLVGMVIVGSYQIITRYFSTSRARFEELLHSLLWMVFLASAYGFGIRIICGMSFWDRSKEKSDRSGYRDRRS